DTTAPTDGTLTATAGDAQVSLSWSGFSDATSGIGSYRLMYSINRTPGSCSIGAGSTGTQICSGTTSSCTITGLTNGRIYYYRVCAKDNAGNASTGVTASAKPQAAADTTAPTGSISINIGAAYTSSTYVTLTLSASDAVGITGYYVSTSSSTPSASATGWTSISWGTIFNASISYNLSSGDGTKTIYVWYKDSAGNVSSTYSDSIVLDTTAPTDGTFSVTPGNSQIELSWGGFSDALSGIGSYTIVYSTNSTPGSCSSGTSIYSGTNTLYTHTGLTGNTTYYYRLCATDNAGNTSKGTIASAQPKTPDINVTLTPPSNTTVSKGSRLGPFSISMKNNTSSSYPFYVYIYLVNPDGTWTTLTSKSLTLSGSKTLTINNLYQNISTSTSTGTYYYWVGAYDTSYNLLDYDYFTFTVTSSTSKSGTNDWGISGW
ncbi:MAG: fibronectin type III domain-containing protein, partial [Nitrospirae bacterium]|nr:fibronectin type III domain-containing protein [Nitrospirota bacterium]